MCCGGLAARWSGGLYVSGEGEHVELAVSLRRQRRMWIRAGSKVDELFEGYGVIVDGCDNVPTRYLVNDACCKHGIPNVHGSIYRFEGQATVFWPGKGPCYRCLFPEPPPPEMAPSCAEAGSWVFSRV